MGITDRERYESLRGPINPKISPLGLRPPHPKWAKGAEHFPRAVPPNGAPALLQEEGEEADADA